MRGLDPRQDRFDRLRAIASAESTLEEGFIRHLFDNGHKLPDKAQYRPCNEVLAQVDFYYEKGRVCVFVDGPHHDESAQSEKDIQVREDLEDLGYKVIVIRYDRTTGEQVAEYPDVFG